jgi:hypothetical protein
LLLDDDQQVMERTYTPSTLIADLVHKGLAYEALAKGADDPVLASLQESRRAHLQTQIFVACLFLTLTAKFEFPLENCNDDERAEIHELLTVPANELLTLATTVSTVRSDDLQPETAPPVQRASRQRVSG